MKICTEIRNITYQGITSVPGGNIVIIKLLFFFESAHEYIKPNQLSPTVTNAAIFSTFKAPCNNTQNDGVVVSSAELSSVISASFAFAVGVREGLVGRMRCRLIAIGEPISATGTKPYTSNTSDI